MMSLSKSRISHVTDKPENVFRKRYAKQDGGKD